MQVFYHPEITEGNNYLGAEESHHCSKVLRMKSGEEVSLIDGNGTMAEGVIKNPDPKSSLISIDKIFKNYNPRPYRLHVAIAPPKSNSRFEWFLEKSTEIGIDKITPIYCERSERKTINRNRAKKIIWSAMKQSITAHEPKLEEMTSFKDFIENNRQKNTYMAYCNNDIIIHLQEVANSNTDTCVLIGPEGGFSPAEAELALNNNIALVSLGKSRLRTETAGLVVCQILNLINQ